MEDGRGRDAAEERGFDSPAPAYRCPMTGEIDCECPSCRVADAAAAGDEVIPLENGHKLFLNPDTGEYEDHIG